MFQDEVEHTVKGLSASDNFLDSMSSSNSEVDSRCVGWKDGQSKCTRSKVNEAQTEQVEWTGKSGKNLNFKRRLQENCRYQMILSRDLSKELGKRICG
jgi:hypothetical protein